METARNLERAELIEIHWTDSGTVEEVGGGKRMKVQFNPSTLKVAYANKVQSNDSSTGSSMQFVGKGTSRLTMEFIFDVSAERATSTQDVREHTKLVAQFIEATPEGDGDEKRFKVSGVRFQWGTFEFDGVIESMNETLELWSEDGRPLRATVAISMGYQGISLKMRPNGLSITLAAGVNLAGTTPLAAATAGASVQAMVGGAGVSADWKAVAAANGIENPRQLAAGTLVDLNVKASTSVST